MDYLKEIVRTPIGCAPGVPVGTVKEYINLTEAETAKLLYQRLNRNRGSNNLLSLQECTEYAHELRNGIPSQYFTERAKGCRCSWNGGYNE